MSLNWAMLSIFTPSGALSSRISESGFPSSCLILFLHGRVRVKIVMAMRRMKR